MLDVRMFIVRKFRPFSVVSEVLSSVVASVELIGFSVVCSSDDLSLSHDNSKTVPVALATSNISPETWLHLA